MVTAEHIGRPAIVRAADHFYAFIDGWRGVIEGFASGLVLLAVPQMEEGKEIKKIFYLPPNQLELCP